MTPEKTSAELIAELREMGQFVSLHQSKRYATLLSQLEHALKIEREASNREDRADA